MVKKTFFLVFLCLVLTSSFVFSDEPLEIESTFPPHAILNASYKGDEKMVREILATLVDKDVRDALGATALHYAMFQSNITVVKLLLDYGFDPNAVTTKNGYTPLHNAVAADNVAAARLLLQHGADKGIKCHEGFTPLEIARKKEKSAMASLLSH